MDREVKEEGKLLTRSSAILRGKEDNLVKDLKETTLSLEKLGEKYGVSRQAIHAFSKKQEIKRKPKGHQAGECHLCQKLIRISKKPHSEFISVHTIVKKNRGIKGRMALPCPETERTGIGQSKVWKIPLRNSGEGLCDLFYRETPDPSDRAESRIKEFSVNHQAASAIGMECSTLPL